MIDKAEVLASDASDPLEAKREEFVLPENTIYLDGNSLGVLPKRAKARLDQTVNDQWSKDLIKSWNVHGWIDAPIAVGEKIAPLLGAAPEQVVCCDSISINLFKLLSSALMLNKGRKIILSQEDNFPTDLYMAQGLESLLGSEKCQLKQVSAAELVNSLDDSVAVLMLTHVNFRSGEMHDMQALTRLAHDKGILVLWDLAHSAGALPIELDQCDVDFAVGCGYKYLNGGPGAPAFVYVAKRHQVNASQPLSGWMGHSSPFDFESHYTAAAGVSKFLVGTPNVLSMAALDGALDVFADVSMQAVQIKSQALIELFLTLLSQYPALNELKNISPTDAAQRGSQLALVHESAFAISQALIDRSVVVDFRAPNIVRFGFTPLYLRYADIWDAVEILNDILVSEEYLAPEFNTRSKVT